MLFDFQTDRFVGFPAFSQGDQSPFLHQGFSRCGCCLGCDAWFGARWPHRTAPPCTLRFCIQQNRTVPHRRSLQIKTPHSTVQYGGNPQYRCSPVRVGLIRRINRRASCRRLVWTVHFKSHGLYADSDAEMQKWCKDAHKSSMIRTGAYEQERVIQCTYTNRLQ